MDIKQAEELKNKSCDYIKKILEKLEEETGMVVQEVFVESDENLKPKVDLHLRLKVVEEVEK